MQHLIHYVHEHHDQPLSINELADVVGYSPFHFQRLCQATLGIGPGKLNELVRLQRGFYLLKFRPWLTVTEVAFACGYASVDGFSRAFKRSTGYSPKHFQVESPLVPAPLSSYLVQWQKEPSMPSQNTDFAAEVVVEQLSELTVCTLRHSGNPAGLPATIQRFIGWRRGQGLPPDRYRTFNFLHNDPATVAPEAFCFDLACEKPTKPVVPDDGMFETVIPSGRYAALTVVGSESQIEAAVNYLTSDYLAANNEVAGEFPVIVERVTFYPEVSYHQAKSHIRLLLSK